MKEIEKKFLVGDIDLSSYEFVDIEQAYLNIRPDPIIRIRKYDNKYFLTYKTKIDTNKNLNIANEYKLPINEEVYKKLKKKIEGNIIKKRRYLIDIGNGLKAELDVYFGCLKGLKTVEVEFKNEKEYLSFKSPTWFLQDVTKDIRYINSSLAMINKLEELEEK